METTLVWWVCVCLCLMSKYFPISLSCFVQHPSYYFLNISLYLHACCQPREWGASQSGLELLGESTNLLHCILIERCSFLTQPGKHEVRCHLIPKPEAGDTHQLGISPSSEIFSFNSRTQHTQVLLGSQDNRNPQRQERHLLIGMLTVPLATVPSICIACLT